MTTAAIETQTFMVRYGRAGTNMFPTERRARNRIRKLLAEAAQPGRTWRWGFQNDTDIALYAMDENGTPTLIERVEVPA